ncbi:MAG: HAMP domain-containing histidine kinase [Deltaproteobacteria bacterium]|nr:HAMP domain-containing histidine kinase [Deltaproteobacteria bacterium]
MANKTRDVVGFKRIFILFSTLVLVPALLMSSFVVVAINNEHQAELRRIQIRSEEQLRQARAAFARTIDESDGAIRTQLSESGVGGSDDVMKRLQGQGYPIRAFALLGENGILQGGTWPFVNRAGQSAIEENVQDILRALASSPRAHLPVSRRFFRNSKSSSAPFDKEKGVDDDNVGEEGTRSIQTESGRTEFHSGLISAQRLEDGRIGIYLLDEERLKTRLEASVELDTGFRFQLLLPRTDERKASGALERFIASVTKEQERAETPTAASVSNSNTQISFRPQSPFERFTLQVSAPKDERFTGIIYLILALVCMTVLITGVVLTSRLIWQEAKLSRLKTDFVSHVSHELRTPLTSIRMFIETLSLGRASSKEEEQECLDLLTKETKRLSDMIERVLGYARLQSGKRTFSLRPVPVEEIIDDAISAFRAQYMGSSRRGESLELRKELADNLPSIEVDPDSMVEALLNLLSNAYKYTGREKVIRVVAKLNEKTGKVCVNVEDNGAGLRKTEVTQVFDRFYQAGALLSDKPSGSGLGLAITRGIVEGNRGKISVVSELGQGARFTIELKPYTAAQP